MDNDYARHIEKMKQMLQAREVAFEILGVKASASDEKLKQAYRQACLKYHPDRNPHDSEAHKQFLLIKSVCDLLTEGKLGERLLESLPQRGKRSGSDKYNLDNPWEHILWWREKFFSASTENGFEPEAYHI